MAKRKRRRFTTEFKAKVVLEAPRGESSEAELCRNHNLSKDQLSKWKHQLIENAASASASDKQSGEMTERIAHLEQRVSCQTTRSLQAVRPWANRLQTLEVSRCDQV